VAESRFSPSHVSDPLAFCVFATPKSFVLVAASAYEKEQWIEKLSEVFRNSGASAADAGDIDLDDESDEDGEGTQSKSRSASLGHAQIWEPDHTAKACLACGKKFSFIKRRYAYQPPSAARWWLCVDHNVCLHLIRCTDTIVASAGR